MVSESDALVAAAIALRDDMLRRAKINAWQHVGEIVVEAGNGAWRRFNDALNALQKGQPNDR